MALAGGAGIDHHHQQGGRGGACGKRYGMDGRGMEQKEEENGEGKEGLSPLYIFVVADNIIKFFKFVSLFQLYIHQVGEDWHYMNTRSSISSPISISTTVMGMH